jgi:putative ABC transport system permease protein
MIEPPLRQSRLAARLYRLLLLAYPAAFRHEHGDEAARVFARLHAEARGPAAVARLWARAIGNVIPDGCRERFEGVTMRDVRHDLISAFRQIRKQPGLALATMLIMSVGIGASTAVLAVVDGALLRPLPFPDAGPVVYVTDRQGTDGGLPASWPEFEDWRREGRVFAAIAAFASNLYTLPDPAGAESLLGGLVGGDFMAVLGVPPVAGRGLLADEHTSGARVLMLSERHWRSRYGADPAVVGRQLVLDGERYTIVGVMPRAADLLVRRQDVAVWLPLDLPESFRARGFHLLTVMARLAPGLTPDTARPRADALAESLRATGATTHGLDLAPVRETLVGDARPLLLLLLGAVAFLLLIVAANLSNLFLARSHARTREFTVRAALGAGRFRLARQLLTECVVLSLAGGALGLVLAHWGVAVVADAADRAAALAPAIVTDVRVLLIALAVSAGVGLLFGLAPALRAATRPLDATLRATDTARAGGSRSSRRHRQLLAGVELALAVVLLVGAGLLVKSLAGLLRTEAGFRIERLLTFSVGLGRSYGDAAAQVTFFDTLLGRLRALPGVEAASAVSHLPLGGGDTNGSFEIAGRAFPAGELPYSKKRIAAPGYFETMGIPLVRGRTFDERDVEGAREVVVISDAIARRYWPNDDPLGRQIAFGWGPGDPQEIVGVVGDVRHDGLDQPVEGAIYRPLAQFPRRGMTVVLRTAGDPLAVAAAVRAEVAAIDPSQPIQRLAAMTDVVRRSVITRETIMRLLAGFAAIALVLSIVGVYAVTAHGVGQRTREIGVRMAMGARSADVLRMVLREQSTLIAAALAAGMAGAWTVSDVLRASLHEVSPTDPQVFAGVAVTLGLVALAASWLPARRAARVDPLSALKAE